VLKIAILINLGKVPDSGKQIPLAEGGSLLEKKDNREAR
jgi:hypothetical protein